LPSIRRFDHVGITVADLDTVSTFFVELGVEIEGRTFLEGEFLDTVIGIPDSRTEIVMLRLPDGGTGLELASFVRPNHEPGSPAAMATELGLRSVAFEVDGLQAIIQRLEEDGYGLVGGIGEYEHVWRMASVRGQKGLSSPLPSGSTDLSQRHPEAFLARTLKTDVGRAVRWRLHPLHRLEDGRFRVAGARPRHLGIGCWQTLCGDHEARQGLGEEGLCCPDPFGVVD
jgi:catechol 2,3-dioxygenase-like lactoylglutathione lyase family enzyme